GEATGGRAGGPGGERGEGGGDGLKEPLVGGGRDIHLSAGALGADELRFDAVEHFRGPVLSRRRDRASLLIGLPELEVAAMRKSQRPLVPLEGTHLGESPGSRLPQTAVPVDVPGKGVMGTPRKRVGDP